ncbi:hypothetical protein N0O92_03455 [Alkalihalobacillus sp. MEB130]|uniref:hypothetical protein n=1 Tax=Alkalihalobacillus sp. MEB130 TaxID=2976704 RepID=UPI0028E056E8|nr:hypothetical protein [Alkalihalobacillus sp. MEB130]MDT8859276.1 hypothetical protein [Alkalihalobacillus sp. MEB130]
MVHNLEDLKQFQVYVVSEPSGFMTVSGCLSNDFDNLMTSMSISTGSPTSAVATSVFMRRYGFFISAQLYLKAFNKVWDGGLANIHLVQTETGLAFQIDKRFIRDSQPDDLILLLKKYGHPVVNTLSKKANISKIILWENIWGYVLWMYGFIDSEQAKIDLTVLLEDDIWQPEVRRSMFKKFLNGRSLIDATQDYQRVTCCLYKELPENDACPYCPNAKSQNRKPLN